MLPSRFPNLLVNGSTGIAVGMATNIPTHNLREVASAVQWSLEHPDAPAEELLEAAMERIKGPDFPNGALIVGRKGIEDAYRTGRGSVIMRAVIDIEEDKPAAPSWWSPSCRTWSIPDNLALKIAELVTTRQDQRHRRHPRRLVRAYRPAAGDRAQAGRPAAGGDEQPLQAHPAAGHLRLQHAGAGRRRAADAAARPVHLLLDRPPDPGHPAAYPAPAGRRADPRPHLPRPGHGPRQLDEVIALIRRSPSTDDAREGLKELLEIDDLQANAILDMQLRRLAAMERQQIIDQLAEFERIIADLKDILARPERQRKIISDELAEIVEKYGDERRTEIIAADGDMSDEDFIPDAEVVVTITRGGYAKRTRTDLYRVQKRGGKGVRGATLRTDDEVDHLFATTNHHWILFFTNMGRVYRAKVWQLPEAGRDAKGGHVAGLLSFLPDEQIAQVLAIRDYDDAPYLLLATKRGLVKKTALRAYDSPRQAGIIAINFREEDDELIGAELCAAR